MREERLVGPSVSVCRSAWMAGVSIPMGYSAYMISVQNAQLYEKYVCDDQMSVPNITKV